MKNLHLRHLEDCIFYPQGEYEVFFLLNSLEKKISGNGEISHSVVSIKWDGSPAFIFGKNPENGEYFIGTKSVLIGNKICQSHEDIQIYYGDRPELVDKMVSLWDNLPKIENVVQGDLIWNSKSIKTEGPGFRTRMNTLEYFFPYNKNTLPMTPIGVALHTTYIDPDGNAKSLKDLNAVYGGIMELDYDQFNDIEDLKFNRMPTLVYLEEFKEDFSWASKRILEQISRIDQVFLIALQEMSNIREAILRYINYNIRNNDRSTGEGFYTWFFLDKEIKSAKLKTEKAKKKLMTEYFVCKDLFPPNDLQKLFDFHYEIQLVKKSFIFFLDNVVEKLTNISVYLPNGKKCGHEGYVLSDQSRGPVKMVNRFVFSAVNMNGGSIWKEQ